VPSNTLVHRARHLSRWLAVWIAALLAIAPAARPFLPLEPAVHSLDLRDQAAVKPEERGSHLRPAQPSASILSRLLLVETTLGLPPVKPAPTPSSSGGLPPSAATTAAMLGGESQTSFHRDSVGTARTPTGPPL